MAERPGSERYEAVPGLLALPGWLIAKLSPRGRRFFWVAAGVLAVAVAALAVVLAPRITRGKHERAAADRRQAAAATARERRSIAAEQVPHSGTARRPLTAGLEAAILADVTRRVRSGELQNRARRTDCSVIGHLGRGGGRRTAYDCTAVTSVIPGTGGNEGGIVGYPYRAIGDPRTGRYTFCKVSGRAGEGQLTSQRTSVALSPRCVG